MHAFLFTGNNQDAIEQEIAKKISEWKISQWDITKIIAEGTVGIELIRDFTKELALSPRSSPAKVGVVPGMERLTVEAQNALLKSIEEPPPNTFIIGTTANPEALLPTIRSRMTVIKLSQTAETYDTKLLQRLLSESPGKRLATLEPYVASRDGAKKFVVQLIGAARQDLLNNPTPELTKLIRNLLEAETMLSVNVNQRLVVDNIFP